MKNCFGCGQLPAKAFSPTTGQPLPQIHPWVAVMNQVDAGVGKDPLRFTKVEVCAACQGDPAHRRNFIKGTFFPNDAQADTAVSLAGERDKNGNPIPTP